MFKKELHVSFTSSLLKMVSQDSQLNIAIKLRNLAYHMTSMVCDVDKSVWE